MSRYTYEGTLEERRAALRKGINSLSWMVGAIIVLFVWRTDFDWNRFYPWGEWSLKAALSAIFVLLLRLFREDFYELAGVYCDMQYRHIVEREGELIDYLDEAYDLYSSMKIASEENGIRSEREFATTLPSLVEEEGARRAKEFLEKGIEGYHAEMRKRLPIFGDVARCRKAAEYYFRYLKKQRDLDYGWHFSTPDDLGNFLLICNTWKVRAIEKAIRQKPAPTPVKTETLDDRLKILVKRGFEYLELRKALKPVWQQFHRLKEKETSKLQAGSSEYMHVMDQFRRIEIELTRLDQKAPELLNLDEKARIKWSGQDE